VLKAQLGKLPKFDRSNYSALGEDFALRPWQDTLRETAQWAIDQKLVKM
jgi:hypothetical protein